MEKFVLRQIKYIVYVYTGLGLLGIFFTLVSIKSFTGHYQTNAEQKLICPTPFSPKYSLQMVNCSMPIPSPTALPPSPTISTPPAQMQTSPPAPSTGTNINYTSPTQGIDPCATQQTNYTVIKQSLLTNYKINLEGDPNVAWADQAYTTICKLFKSNTFANLLTSQGTLVLSFTNGTSTSGACVEGYASETAGISITGSCTPQLNRAILVHEFGHMVAYRNPAVFNNFLNNIWPAKIPTYNCLIHFGDGPTPIECFADGVAEYVVYSYMRIILNNAPAGTITFTQYPTQYANYYNFMQTNVFQGVSFPGF